MFNGDAFFLAGDHTLQWLKLSHSLGSPHVYPEPYPITLGAQGSGLRAPAQSNPHIVFVMHAHWALDLCPPDYNAPMPLRSALAPLLSSMKSTINLQPPPCDLENLILSSPGQTSNFPRAS